MPVTMGFIHRSIEQLAVKKDYTPDEDESQFASDKFKKSDISMPSESDSQTLDMAGLGSSMDGSGMNPDYIANSPPDGVHKKHTDFDKNMDIF